MSPEFLLQELLKERRKDRWLAIARTALLFLVGVAYLVGMAVTFGVTGSQPKDYVALVKVSGMIADGKEASYENLAPALKAAFEDKTAKGVILQINSPGGTPVQASLIHDLIVELKQKHQKPVVAVGEDMMTSGAYFIAVAADKIYANRSTVAGSIGVISAGFGFTGLMDKLGIERRVATAGESKNMLDAFAPANAADKEKQKELLSDIHTHFKDTVKAGRAGRLKLDTPSLFEGSVWTGAKALDIGLIDGLGSVDQVAQREFKVENTVQFNRKKLGVESLLAGITTAAVDRLVPTAQAPSPQPLAVY